MEIKKIKGKYFILINFLLFLNCAYGNDINIKIGVLANNGIEQCHGEWDPLADYLSARIDRYTFEILPLGYDEIIKTAESTNVDFIICNPLIYVELELNYDIRRILTLDRQYEYGNFSFFSSLIFTASGNSKINSCKDLKNSRIAAVETNSLGGWLMAARELKNNGLDIPDSFKSLVFLGSHEEVVSAVLDGKYDAGIVRSGTVENMISRKLITKQQVKNIGGIAHNNENLPFIHSTAHYPEWPLAMVSFRSKTLALHIMKELLVRDSDTAGRLNYNILWTIPENYESVKDCMKELRYGPYENYGKVSFVESIHQHILYNLILFFTIVILLFLFTRIVIIRKNLKKLYEENSLITSKTDLMIIKVRINGEIQEANKAAEKRFNLKISKNKKANLKDFLSEEEFARRLEGMIKAAEMKEKYSIVTECQGGWSDIEIQPIVNEKNKKTELFNFYIRDVTGWVETGNELKKLNMMLGLLKEMIVITDTEGNIEYCNDTFCNFNAYSRDELEKKNINIVINSIDKGDISSIIKKDETVKNGWEENITITKKNNDTYTGFIRIVPVNDINKKLTNMICIIRDITVESAVIKAEREHIKSQAINYLISGVAHDFNNSLMKIMGLTEILSMKERESSDVLMLSSKIIGETRKASINIEKLINTMGKYSSAAGELINVNEMIKNTISEYQLRHSIRIKTDFLFSSGIWLINSAKEIFCDSIIELYKNSLEAIQYEGQISIKTQNIPLNSVFHLNARYDLNDCNYILIEINDTGEGIPSENLELLTDPYFSTRGIGRGMGLSLVNNYVKQMNGFLHIESKVKDYTSVKIFLPV